MPTITVQRKKSWKGMLVSWHVFIDGYHVEEPLKSDTAVSFEVDPGHHELYVEANHGKGSDILEFGADDGQHFIFECGPKSMFTLFDPRIGVKLELKDVRSL